MSYQSFALIIYDNFTRAEADFLLEEIKCRGVLFNSLSFKFPVQLNENIIAGLWQLAVNGKFSKYLAIFLGGLSKVQDPRIFESFLQIFESFEFAEFKFCDVEN